MPLHRAIERAGPGMVETLVDHGADVGEKNGAGLTPIELTELVHYEEQVRAILQR